MTEKIHHWNLKYQIQDPIFHDVYGMNVENPEKNCNFELKLQPCKQWQTTSDWDWNHPKSESGLVLAVHWSLKSSHHWRFQEDQAYDTLPPLKIVEFSISSTTWSISKTLHISSCIFDSWILNIQNIRKNNNHNKVRSSPDFKINL